MNVFEDLLVDLKQQNLLEDTVLEEHPCPGELNDQTIEFADAPGAASQSEVPGREPHSVADLTSGFSKEPVVAVAEPPKEPKGAEFFRKRAVAEMSGLQMVEHVLTGVEREYMKMKPEVFDDLKAKLALNKFLQASDSDEHKAAEFALMRETEAWCTALAERDSKVPVSSLRQYCENTKPALSSQAVLALCRFYRNLPYTESVRAKFDFLITRLFSRPVANDERVCLFKREEAIGHLENLYKDWSSVSLYVADDDDSKVMLTALSFDELAEESENASTFDLLIESGFFGRLRMFKESIADLFFAPQVAVAAIESNVRIGNSYVKLIAAERQKMDADSINAKYVELDHESVSDATARTLELVDLLKAPAAVAAVPAISSEPMREDVREQEPIVESGKEATPDGFSGRMIQSVRSVNRWLLASAALMIIASIGIYVWANYYVEDTVPSAGVRTLAADSPVVAEHLKTAKISNETFYGLLQPSWDALPKEQRVEYVQRLLQQGAQLGFRQVSLTNKEGKAAAYGSKEKIEVQMP